MSLNSHDETSWLFFVYDMRVHIEAIILKKRAVREFDQLVILYSRELGKVGVLAKGSLKSHSRQAPALDEGSLIHCELVDGRSGPIMTGAQTVRAFSSMKRSPVAWAVGQFFLQAADALVFDAQSDEGLWECLSDIFTRLDDDTDTLRCYREGQQALLNALGYGGPPTVLGTRWVRTALDEQFEVIAQRRLSAIDLLYDVAAMSRS
jgi:DNA repair protein RecO